MSVCVPVCSLMKGAESSVPTNEGLRFAFASGV